MNLIGIDYSINSPGLCIYNKDASPIWFSYLKPKTGTKKDQAVQAELKELNDVFILDQPEPNTDRQELSRVLRHREIADGVCNMMQAHGTGNSFSVFFEGASYGTSRFGTNSLIDLAAASSILKSMIIERFDVQIMEVFAPTSIKKFAGKGNMNKQQMWEAFLADESLESSQFWQFCQQYSTVEVKSLAKPLDDLVDAYFIVKYARSLE